MCGNLQCAKRVRNWDELVELKNITAKLNSRSVEFFYISVFIEFKCTPDRFGNKVKMKT